jgi:uncharacterized protein (DUF433 family)
VGERKTLGRFIVMDPSVRGGEPTFRGTQIAVREVVEGIAHGQHWDTLVERSEGRATFVSLDRDFYRRDWTA